MFGRDMFGEVAVGALGMFPGVLCVAEMREVGLITASLETLEDNGRC